MGRDRNQTLDLTVGMCGPHVRDSSPTQKFAFYTYLYGLTSPSAEIETRKARPNNFCLDCICPTLLDKIAGVMEYFYERD